MVLETGKYNLEKLKSSLGDLPEPVLKPVFIIISGLPGTGKSYLSKKLAEIIPACIIESDAVRKMLWNKPVYDSMESESLFRVCHKLAENLLKDGISVVFDATNLTEYHRERLYNIGEKTNAKMLIVATTASEEVVRQRLDKRKSGSSLNDKSDADWDIYRKMRSEQQNIRRNFILADTSSGTDKIIDKIARIIKKRSH